jgi:hypothetical protein
MLASAEGLHRFHSTFQVNSPRSSSALPHHDTVAVELIDRDVLVT